VHEYTVAGGNRLELVVWPHPAPTEDALQKPPAPLACKANGIASAHLRLLLPRGGQPVDEGSARTLGQIAWAPESGQAYDAPLSLGQDVQLAVNFPRWRWLDAPMQQATPALRERALAFVQQIASSLGAGDPEPFLAATRLKTEELAVAYLRNAGDDLQRLRTHLQAAHEAGRLNWLPMAAETFVLRSIAGGRLLECLDASGQPMLRGQPDDTGVAIALPLRLAAVEGRFYGLR
jgi:hypothetical protein